MTQQEIQENRTQGKYSSNKTGKLYADRKPIAALWFNESAYAFDAAAIVSAVNNTYGKGINPEAVEDLYDALDKAINILQDTNITQERWNGFLQVLNASKL